MRARRTPLLAAGLIVFLGLSFLTARYLSVETRERNLIVDLLGAQARGDAEGVIGRLDGCASAPSCVERARVTTARLRRPGRISIARYDSGTVHALGAARGPTRVVWLVPRRSLTVVQCVDVQRTGNALRGHEIRLRGLSGPIRRLSSCPGQAPGR